MRAGVLALTGMLFCVGGTAQGETLSDALIRAYQGNPQLNADARAPARHR